MAKLQAAFAACLVLTSTCFAEPKIVDDGLLVDGAKQKISQISDELYAKTGVSIVLYMQKTLNNENILTYEANISKSLKEPFILVIFAEQEKKVDVTAMPTELSTVVNKDYILNNRIIPILGAQGDKNSNESRYSAAILNGVAEIADRVAESKNITLESSLGSQTTWVMNLLRFIFYGVIVASVGILIYRRYFK